MTLLLYGYNFSGKHCVIYMNKIITSQTLLGSTSLWRAAPCNFTLIYTPALFVYNEWTEGRAIREENSQQQKKSKSVVHSSSWKNDN